MSEKSTMFEKYLKIQNIFSIGLLAVALFTGSGALGVAAIGDGVQNAIVSSEYSKYKARKKKKGGA